MRYASMILVVLGVAWLAAAAAQPRVREASRAPTAPAPQPAGGDSEYELVVGGKGYPIAPDQSVVLQTPSGDKVQVTLRRNPRAQYSGNEISFSYDRSMKLKEENEKEHVQLSLDLPDSFMSLFIYKVAIGPDVVRKEMAESFRTQMRSQNFRLQRELDTSRQVLGQQRKGSRAVYGNGDITATVEVLAFEVGGRTMVAILYTDPDERELAEKCFQQVFETLKAAE